jgi:NAD(P)H dehydrogenase (quinone)
VHELAPEEAIKSNQGWYDHALMTEDVPEASMEDLEWADAYVFGTPTRFGNVSRSSSSFWTRRVGSGSRASSRTR